MPLSARKELPDNLGPQNGSQMNDNRKGTVDFLGVLGGPPMLPWSVRPSVRPQKSVRPPYLREIAFFGALKPPCHWGAGKTKKCKTRGARRAFAIDVWSASVEAKVL